MLKRVADKTDAELADEWGRAKEREDAVGQRIDELKKEFERRKLEFAAGNNFMVFRDVSDRVALVVALVREKMGEAWCRQFEKSSTRISYRVKPRKESAD